MLPAVAMVFFVSGASISPDEVVFAAIDDCHEPEGISLLQRQSHYLDGKENPSAPRASTKGSQTIATDASSELARSKLAARAPLVKQHMIVCNAYHGSAPLEILHVEHRVKLTKNKPLKYKACQEYTLPLMEGDRLDFNADGGHNIGTFHATSMPKASASLLLIPRHRENTSKPMAFESHAFANLKSPQIAVVDAYRGNATNTVHIIENLAEVEQGQAPLTEALRFNSVVAVAPGKYNVGLLGSEAIENVTVLPLHVRPHTKSVIMRVGGGKFEDLALPQELVVYPNSVAGRCFSALVVGWIMIAVHF